MSAITIWKYSSKIEVETPKGDTLKIPLSENLSDLERCAMIWASEIAQTWKEPINTQTLIKIGRDITQKIFSSNIEILKAAFGMYQPTIDIRVFGESDTWIPWEMLYLGEAGENALEKFCGFQRNIYRGFHKEPRKIEITSDPALGFLAHHRIPFIEEESAILKDYIESMKWPKLKSNLWKIQGFNIVHIAGLMQSFESLRESHIFVEKDFWLSPDKFKDFHFTANPLVILNVREEQARNPIQIMAYAKLLLQKKAAGIITSEFPVPPKVAMEFAKFFYERLFNCGDAGEALAETKKAYSNPFAMFYAPYFQPDAQHEQGGKTIMILELLTTATISAGVKFLFDRFAELTNRLNKDQLEKVKAKQAEIDQSIKNVRTDQDVEAVRNSLQELIRFMPNDLEIDSINAFATWMNEQLRKDYRDLRGLSKLVAKVLEKKADSEEDLDRRDELQDMLASLNGDIGELEKNIRHKNDVKTIKVQLNKRMMGVIDMLKEV